jgi:hypothetical protein
MGSAFEAPLPLPDDHSSGNGHSAGPVSKKRPKVESPSAEIGDIAGVIEELESRLEQARAQLAQASTAQTTEFEIGRLFVEAQRFSEASVSKLEGEIQEIMDAAHATAAEIVRAAIEEAQETRRKAERSSFIPSHMAQELQVAIVGFTTVNNELIKELNAINTLLRPLVDRRFDSLDPESTLLGSM